METSSLENWLWEAACSIRGPIAAPQYRDYILPLLFYKRLCDVYEDTIEQMAEQVGDPALVLGWVENDRSLVRFYIPQEHTWKTVRSQPIELGQRLSAAVGAIAHHNPELEGVIDISDFNATAGGQRILDDDSLARLMEILNRHRLGLRDVEPDLLGRAYEYLLRMFAEGSGRSAGEFRTPREVAILMARVLEPREGETVYDPASGSGGLLIKVQLRLRERLGDGSVRKLELFGQEINHATRAMSRMNAIIHNMEATIELGDTIKNPRFLAEEGRLRTFDIVTANPMWNQKFDPQVYDNDPHHRFVFGTPPRSSADWGWVQHMHASLNGRGRMAVVLDTGSVSRGSGNRGSNKERDVRKAFVEADLVEMVILLPENLFYNTSAPGIIMAINKAKSHPGQILLINATRLCDKGRPKNYLTEEHIDQIAEAYHGWQDVEGLSKVITTEEAARNDYNLSPSRYVATDDEEDVLPLEEALVLLSQAEEDRESADQELKAVLEQLGLEWNSASK